MCLSCQRWKILRSRKTNRLIKGAEAPFYLNKKIFKNFQKTLAKALSLCYNKLNKTKIAENEKRTDKIYKERGESTRSV